MADQTDPAGDEACTASTSRSRDAFGRFVGTGKERKRPRGKTGNAKPGKVATKSKKWRETFLGKLAETSNIRAAALAAGVDSSAPYKARRDDPEFAAAWRAALLIGYEMLELETLCRLREGELKTDIRKFDIANALRLLKAHSEAAAAERALQENLDEQDVLDSIDAMIDSMRERAAANAAILAEDD